MTQLQFEIDGREFYHGTSASSAICILEEGFRILDREVRFWNGALGTGIYATRNLEQAIGFGSLQSEINVYILKLKLARGTRIARIDDQPNRRVLDSLRREFGSEILRPGFEKAIPGNKHLKPLELFALLAHFESLSVLVDSKTLPGVRKWLLRLGYHGYGHTRNDLGVMLFEPARFLVEDVALVRNSSSERFGEDFSDATLQSCSSKSLIDDARKELKQMELEIKEREGLSEQEGDLDVAKKEINRRRRLILSYELENVSN